MVAVKVDNTVIIDSEVLVLVVVAGGVVVLMLTVVIVLAVAGVFCEAGVVESGKLAKHQATIRGVAAKGAPACTQTTDRVVSQR